MEKPDSYEHQKFTASFFYLGKPYKLGEDIEKFNDILKETDYKDDIHKAIREINEDLKKGTEVLEGLDKLKDKVKEIKESF